MGWVLEGSSWVKNMAVSSSAGSTQKAVLAAPPQANSPALDSAFAFTAQHREAEPEPEAVERHLREQRPPIGFQIHVAGKVVARHQRDGAGAEQPHPIQLAAAQQESGIG